MLHYSNTDLPQGCQAVVDQPVSEPATPVPSAIRADCTALHEAARAALVAADIDLSGVRLTLAGYSVDNGKPRHRHFQVGDGTAMAEAATKWAGEGCNVYRSLAANRVGLPPSQRGGTKDAVAVFGLVADLDGDKPVRASVDDLPLAASAVVLTSALPVENYQATYFLTRAIPVRQASVLAWGLAQVIQDGDGGTADPVHVWRLAGTLNVPKESKIARGRPPEPQAVIADPEQRGTGRPVTPEALRDALEVALGIDDLDAAFAAAKGRSQQASGERASHAKGVPPGDSGEAAKAAPEASQEEDAPRGWSGDHWSDDIEVRSRELARVVDALLRIPAEHREVWRQVTSALADWSFGDARVEALAIAWAGGGECEGHTFAGCPSKFDPTDQANLWQASLGASRFSIGTFFEHAKKAGWDASRSRWGLARVLRSVGKPLDGKALAVQKAGLAMPRDKVSYARWVWYTAVVQYYDSSADVLRVASLIAQSFNPQTGFGFRAFDTLSEMLKWEAARAGRGYRRAQVAVRTLALDGFLVISSGNNRGAHGGRGPSYAPTFPDGQSWDDAFAAHSILFSETVEQVERRGSDAVNTKRGDGRSYHLQTVAGAMEAGHSYHLQTVAVTNPSWSQPPSPDGSCDHVGRSYHLQTVAHLTHKLLEEREASNFTHAHARTHAPAHTPAHARPPEAADQQPPSQDQPETRTETETQTKTKNQTKKPTPSSPTHLAPASTPEIARMRDEIAASPAVTFSDLVADDDDGAIPPAVAERLRAAHAVGAVALLKEAQRSLRALKDLGLSSEQIRSQVLDAASFALQGWAKTLKDPPADPDFADIPPRRFARDLGSALAKRVDWCRRDIDTGRLVPGARAVRNMDAIMRRLRQVHPSEGDRFDPSKPIGTVRGTFVNGTDGNRILDAVPGSTVDLVRQALSDYASRPRPLHAPEHPDLGVVFANLTRMVQDLVAARTAGAAKP